MESITLRLTMFKVTRMKREVEKKERIEKTPHHPYPYFVHTYTKF